MDAAKKYRLDVIREILKCKRNAYNLQWCTKGKQNFIVEGVTVILIITCDTREGRKEGRKETNSGVKTTSEVCSPARSFVVERTRPCVHGGISWRAFPYTVELL